MGTINAAIVALAKAFAARGTMTVEEATSKFPQEVGIARYGEPEEIAEPMAFLVSPPGARWLPPAGHPNSASMHELIACSDSTQKKVATSA